MSVDRWMDKENVVHTHIGTLLNHKKWNNAFCSHMDAGGASGEESACQCRTCNRTCNAGHATDTGSLPGWGRCLGVGSSNPSGILAWKIPWTDEPGGLQSIGLHRVGHDWAHTHTHTHTHTLPSHKDRTQENLLREVRRRKRHHMISLICGI